MPWRPVITQSPDGHSTLSNPASQVRRSLLSAAEASAIPATRPGAIPWIGRGVVRAPSTTPLIRFCRQRGSLLSIKPGPTLDAHAVRSRRTSDSTLYPWSVATSSYEFVNLNREKTPTFRDYPLAAPVVS